MSSAKQGELIPKNNMSRAMAILSFFIPDNQPARVTDLIERFKMGRSTGFALIRTMIKAGYLQKQEDGMVLLGQKAADLAFAPLEADYAYALLNSPLVMPMPTTPSKERATARTDEWEPTLLKSIDTSVWAKPGPWHIGFSNASLSNEWRKALVKNIQYAKRIHQDKIETFSIRHAEDDPILQSQQIDELVAAGIDLLIISIANSTDEALSEKLSQLAKDGLPIVAVDRRPGDASSLVSFVTASDRAIGRLSAQWIAERLKGQGRVWMLSGIEGASPAIRRRTAALDRFFEFPDLHIEAMQPTQWTEETGYRTTLDLYQTYGALPDAIWCDSGLQGVGALKFCLEQDEPLPLLSGGDLNQMYKLAITNNCPFIAVDYPAAMGGRALETALDILQGDPVTERREVPVEVVLPRGCETENIKADQWAERHVRWDMPDTTILSQGPSLKYNDRVEGS